MHTKKIFLASAFSLVVVQSRVSMVIEALIKENFQVEIEECANKKDWKKIIKLSQKYGFDISSLLYWVYPTEYCLEQLKVTLKNFNISFILSIGCGNFEK